MHSYGSLGATGRPAAGEAFAAAQGQGGGGGGTLPRARTTVPQPTSTYAELRSPAHPSRSVRHTPQAQRPHGSYSHHGRAMGGSFTEQESDAAGDPRRNMTMAEHEHERDTRGDTCRHVHEAAPGWSHGGGARQPEGAPAAACRLEQAARTSRDEYAALSGPGRLDLWSYLPTQSPTMIIGACILVGALLSHEHGTGRAGYGMAGTSRGLGR